MFQITSRTTPISTGGSLFRMAGSASTPPPPTRPVDRCMSANGNNPLANFFSFVDIFVSFYPFTTSALPPPWSKSFAVFFWSILPYLAPKIPNKPPPFAQSRFLHFLHFFCIHLFILLNIDQSIQLLAFDASTCVKISKVKKKK